ncbi:unnamed protein product [Dibothriocephalus latus]|uniref:SCP domain-containing protein n=1 Tax=Dibothriocephalus latus TaxID=60516 RepID=A0A3P7LJJ9_DIBLA|nr:unnamed protein product [Dibothriocephalus latus]
MTHFAKILGWIAFALLLVLTFAYRIVSSGLKTTTVTAANTSGKAPVPLQERRPQQRPEASAEELKHRNMYLNRYCARRDPINSRYGYATVIEQTRWITNTTAKVR